MCSVGESGSFRKGVEADVMMALCGGCSAWWAWLSHVWLVSEDGSVWPERRSKGSELVRSGDGAMMARCVREGVVRGLWAVGGMRRQLVGYGCGWRCEWWRWQERGVSDEDELKREDKHRLKRGEAARRKQHRQGSNHKKRYTRRKLKKRKKRKKEKKKQNGQ